MRANILFGNCCSARQITFLMLASEKAGLSSGMPLPSRVVNKFDLDMCMSLRLSNTQAFLRWEWPFLTLYHEIVGGSAFFA